jgi:hypothetical protein
LTSPTLTSNSGQNSYMTYCFLFDLFLQKRLLNLFEPLTRHQKRRFDIRFDVFSSELLSRRYSGAITASDRFFFPITDHPSAGKVPPGRGPQCGAAPVKFRSVSCPGPRRVRGEAGSQSGRILMLPHCPGQILETAALSKYAPNTGRGEFTPRESEVKTKRTPVV